MKIDFHAPANRYSYAGREVQPDWAALVRSLVDPAAMRVADIGCGGGLYSAAWADLGAAHVTGVDFSAEMVRTATEMNRGRSNTVFKQGDALATGLPSESADIVFERALIHHLTDYDACFREAARLLVRGGRAIVQDRTPEDVSLPGSPDHIRGYFFECFPRLLEFERARRPTDQAVGGALGRSGFGGLQTLTVWETRKRYDDFRGFAADLQGRVGRSILHALTDAELNQLVDFIGQRLPANAPIVERTGGRSGPQASTKFATSAGLAYIFCQDGDASASVASTTPEGFASGRFSWSTNGPFPVTARGHR